MLPDIGMHGANQSQRMLMTWVLRGQAAPSLHGPTLLLVPTVSLPGGLPCPFETHCTIPTSALIFGEYNYTA